MSVINNQLAILSISKSTPMINALFGCFEVDFKSISNGKLAAARFEQETNASWDVLFGNLRKEADRLGLKVDFDGTITTEYYKGILKTLALHFNATDNEALNDILENHELEDDADFETLFSLAVAFDDGHGISNISVGKSWQSEDFMDVDVSSIEFGGSGKFIGKNCLLTCSSSAIIEFGQELDESLEKNDIDHASLTVAGMVNSLLDSVSNSEKKELLRKALIEKLAAS